MPLRLHKAVKMSNGTWAYGHVTMLLARDPDDTQPHVVLNRHADDVCLELPEAEELVLLLGDLLRTADAAR